MELIFEKLNELNIEEANLPVALQNKINSLDAKIDSLNKRIEELQTDGADDEEIADETADIDEEIEREEAQIVREIVAFANNRNAGNPKPTSGQKEKSGVDGWLIFGAVALVLTFGAVNVFKNK